MINNYIITVDENGFPFIAHTYAYGSGAVGKSHKYVQRVKLPNGKYRYFYSQKEYEAYTGLLKRKREIKNRMDQILKEEDNLRSKYKEKNVFNNYERAVNEHGKNSTQAKKALEEHNRYASRLGELEDEWQKLRVKNIRSADELEKYEK
jgi:hypothetical protein